LSENILAVCSGGGIGDLLAATPAVKALHRHFGDPLTVLATPYAAPVLQDHPSIREVMLDDGTESDRDLARRLAERKFTHCVVFWSTARIAGAVRRAGIPVRVGQARRLYSWKYTTRVTVRTENGDTTSHWTDVQMDYARVLGAEPLSSDYIIEVHLRPEDIAQAEALRTLHGIPPRFAVLHAARGINLDRVRWPVEHFAAIGDSLEAAFEATVLLTGSTADAPTIDAIGRNMTAKHAVVAGQTSVMGLAALLSRAAPVVGLDSGPMHLAAALGAPTVSIFALRTDLPDRWRPLGPRVAIVRPSYPCPPWHRKETCRTFDCYAHLPAGEVIAAARAVAPRSADVDPADMK
jgi:heptosyltransferase-1